MLSVAVDLEPDKRAAVAHSPAVCDPVDEEKAKFTVEAWLRKAIRGIEPSAGVLYLNAHTFVRCVEPQLEHIIGADFSVLDAVRHDFRYEKLHSAAKLTERSV